MLWYTQSLLSKFSLRTKAELKTWFILLAKTWLLKAYFIRYTLLIYSSRTISSSSHFYTQLFGFTLTYTNALCKKNKCLSVILCEGFSGKGLSGKKLSSTAC